MKHPWLTTTIMAALEMNALADPLVAPTPESLYNEGEAAYHDADYATAIAKWQEAYKLSNASGLLLNLAQAYRLNGDCKRALSSYREFISMVPTSEADDLKLADHFVHELDLKCGDPIWSVTQPDPAMAPPKPTQNSSSGGTLKMAGWITGGGGVASIALGLALGHHASVLGGEVTRACSMTSMPCDWATEKSKDASGRHYGDLGHAFDALGVAAIAGGALLYYLGDREGNVHITPLITQPHESGATLSWGTSW
jgi:tetratricopeptide (TPR) repeat protein